MREYLFIVVSMIFIQNYLFCMGGATNIRLPSNINVLATSKNGRYIVAGYCDGKICVVDLEDEDEDNIKILQNNNNAVTAITCGSSYFAIGCKEGDIYVFNYKLDTLSYFQAHTDEISVLAIDESWIAVASQSGVIKVFDLDRPDLAYTPYCLCTIQSQQKITTLVLNRYRRLLTFSYSCILVIWDIINDVAKAQCASSEEITACTSNDTMLWTAGRDKYIRVWDIVSGNQLKAFKIGITLTSLCMNEEKDLLTGVVADKVACVFNCSSGKCIEKAEPFYPYMNHCIVSGETVIFLQSDGDIEIQPIGASFLFKNDLDYPVDNFAFVGEDQRAHNIFTHCKAHDCARLVLDFFLNRFYPYTLQMKIDTAKVFIPYVKLIAVRQMCLIQSIRDAQVFLSLGKKFPKKAELEWRCYWPAVPCIPTTVKEKNICATAHVIGTSLKSLSLTDCLGQSMYAKQRRKFIWDFDVISQNRPYTLLADAEKEKSQWNINNIPNESELIIDWYHHDLCLWHEFSTQILRIPQEKQGSLSSTLP